MKASLSENNLVYNFVDVIKLFLFVSHLYAFLINDKCTDATFHTLCASLQVRYQHGLIISP